MLGETREKTRAIRGTETRPGGSTTYAKGECPHFGGGQNTILQFEDQICIRRSAEHGRNSPPRRQRGSRLDPADNLPRIKGLEITDPTQGCSRTEHYEEETSPERALQEGVSLLFSRAPRRHAS